MKIALVARHVTPPTHAVDPYSADQAAHVSGLGRALAAQGHDVVIYARKDSAALPDAMSIAPRLKAEFIAAGPQAPVPPDQLPQYAKDVASHLAARWREDTPGIVHAYHWTSGLAALTAAREHPVPVVVTFSSLGAAERRHGIQGEQAGVRLRMEAGVARTAATVLATTADEVAELTRLGVPNARVSLVPCGVDTQVFKPAGLIARRKSQSRLVAVGSLTEYRGLDIVLRCLAELPDTELVIAGGPAADALEADHGYRILAKLAAHLGVADRVRFTGQVGDDKLPGLLRSADLLVSAARYEPLGISSIRAMACGVPVVATAVGLYRDTVIDGTTGLLVPPGRPDIFARKLRDLLASPMRLAAFGIASADRAKSRYPWERVAREAVAVYERTIARAPRSEQINAVAAVSGQPVQRLALRAADGAPARPGPRRTGSRQPARTARGLARAGGSAA